MPWHMKADEGGSFEQPPTGPQAAILTRIIDIGTHTDTSPQYGVQRRHQIIFMWELAETMTDGRPYTIQKFYTLSMNEKANLRKDLESWRGKQFDSGEDVEIDVALGKSCMLNVEETQTGKSKVASIMRLPKGMQALAPTGPLLVFRTDQPDWSVYEQLSEFHQKKIAESEEWRTIRGNGGDMTDAQRSAENKADMTRKHGPVPGVDDLAGHGEDFDDDIPF